MNNLKDFTTEELKAELKRRMQKERAIKEEARKNAKTGIVIVASCITACVCGFVNKRKK